MFDSQVIKCYELPYCTLEIFADNRFCLLIENLDFANESSVKLSSDRAQLTELITRFKKQFSSLNQVATPQQAKQSLYPVTLPNKNQSTTAHLSWEQLSDLNKILDQYQADVANNTLVVVRHQRRFWGICSLFLLLIMGGIITRLKWDDSPSTETASRVTESLLPNPQSSQSSTASNPSSSPPKISNKHHFQLSDSLKTLDQLSPPTSVEPVSSADLMASNSGLEQENNPKTKPPPPKLPNDTPSLNVPEFPSFSSQLQAKTAPNQSDTSFDPSSQAAEVRRYFQKQWNPSQQLTQHLEYELLINRNGSLQRIVPLGNAAQNYQEILPFPPKNQPFIAASSREQKIRVVFSPGGEVKTFLMTKAISN